MAGLGLGPLPALGSWSRGYLCGRRGWGADPCVLISRLTVDALLLSFVFVSQFEYFTKANLPVFVLL